jgi:hypothetical protein
VRLLKLRIQNGLDHHAPARPIPHRGIFYILQNPNTTGSESFLFPFSSINLIESSKLSRRLQFNCLPFEDGKVAFSFMFLRFPFGPKSV